MLSSIRSSFLGTGVTCLSAQQFDSLLKEPQIFNQLTLPTQLFIYKFQIQSQHVKSLDLSRMMQFLKFIQSAEEESGRVPEIRSLLSMQVISVMNDTLSNERWKKRVDSYTKHSDKFNYNIPLMGYYERESDGGMTRTLYMPSLPFVIENLNISQNRAIDLLQNWYLFKYNRGLSTLNNVKSVEELLESDSNLLLSDLDCVVKLFNDLASGLSELHAQGLTHNSILPRNITMFETESGFEFMATVPSFGLDNMIDGMNDDHMSYFSPQVFSRFEEGVGEVFTTQNDVHMLGTLMMRILLGEEFDAKQIDADDWDLEMADFKKSIIARLGKNFPASKIEILADLACRCISSSEDSRPTIGEISDILTPLGSVKSTLRQIRTSMSDDDDEEEDDSYYNDNFGAVYKENEVVFDDMFVQLEHAEKGPPPPSSMRKEIPSFVVQSKQPLPPPPPSGSMMSMVPPSSSPSPPPPVGKSGLARRTSSAVTFKSLSSPTRSADTTVDSIQPSFSNSAATSGSIMPFLSQPKKPALVPTSNEDIFEELHKEEEEEERLQPPNMAKKSALSIREETQPSNEVLEKKQRKRQVVKKKKQDLSKQLESKPMMEKFERKQDNSELFSYASPSSSSYANAPKSQKQTSEEDVVQMDKDLYCQTESLSQSSSFQKKSKSFSFSWKDLLSIFEFLRRLFSSKEKSTVRSSKFFDSSVEDYITPIIEDSKVEVDDSLKKKERYLVQKRLSDGASAIILQVKDNETQNIHVMKRFREGVESDYEREVKCLKLFSHKNIVQFVDNFSYTETNDGKTVKNNIVIMEYCNFGDLFKISMSYSTGKPKPMRPLRMLKFTLQLFEAIAHIHEYGYVHSDIVSTMNFNIFNINTSKKPQNIFLAKDGSLKLGDFGFTVKEKDTVAGGTLHYLPPEQEEGQPAVLASDLYSAACSMFEVLAKKKVSLKSKQGAPTSFEEVWDQHNKNNIHFHRKKYNPHAVGLFEVFKNCLEADHTKRKPAKEIVETVRGLLQNHSATMVQKRYRGYNVRKSFKNK